MNDQELITIAILAKDKSHTLPIYLSCILNLDYPKDKILIYIRSNNNNDNTIEILSKWIDEYGMLYKEVYFNYTDVPEQISQFKQHEWNSLRFKVLATIRNDSLNWAYLKGTHYFVADCDNFILPMTLKNLYLTKVPIVGPLLTSTSNGGNYSNFHEKTDPQGYFENSAGYYDFLYQKITSLVSVDVIHCTYFIRYEYLNKLSYFDRTSRHEYVIFSDSARKQNILQFLDTRFNYGRITFAETEEELEKEPWYPMFIPRKLIISPQSKNISNRFLALASSFAFGDKYNYKLYYMWFESIGFLTDFIFPPSGPKWLENQIFNIDQILTEWLPNDFWYTHQSWAQKKWISDQINIDLKIESIKINNDLKIEMIKESILIETSLQFPFVSPEEITIAFQKYFRPLNIYTSFLKSIPDIDIGIWITRKHIFYFPESNQSPEEICLWIKNFSTNNIIIFCDDKDFLSQIQIDESICIELNNKIHEVMKGEDSRQDFLKFLILANKCSMIYGTPGDSLCYVAGLFNGKRHDKTILS